MKTDYQTVTVMHSAALLGGYQRRSTVSAKGEIALLATELRPGVQGIVVTGPRGAVLSEIPWSNVACAIPAPTSPAVAKTKAKASP